MEANALTRTEASEFAQHERTIERGLSTFREVGSALTAIRDSKLYRLAFKTFESYCKERWGWSRQHANYLITAQETAVEIDNHGCQKPTNERQLRPLSKLPKEQRAEVWEQVADVAPKDENGKPKITAKLVKDVVDEWVAEEVADEPAEMFDYLDQPVPAHAHQAFHDEQLIDDAIGQLKAAFKAAEAVEQSAAGKFLNLKQFRALLKDAKALLEATRPFAVCPYCEGRKCSACAQIGVVPKQVHQAH